MPKNQYPIALILLITFVLSVVTPVLANTANTLTVHAVEVVANEDGEFYTVQVRVSALDRSLKPITNLRQGDFKVFEDEQPVELTGAEFSSALPINVILVLDTSGSMSGERLRQAKQATVSFIDSLYRGDQAAVFTFGNDVNKIVDLTDDLNSAKRQFESANIVAIGATRLYDAVYSAVQMAQTLPDSRTAVLVLSDGEDTNSIQTADSVITLARSASSNVPIYTIGIGNEFDAGVLTRMAEQTGGTYSQSTRDADLPQLFNEVAEQLAAEYLLTYTSSTAPGDHTIKVQVDSVSASRTVTFPALPPRVSFAYPPSGTLVEDNRVKVTLSVVERGIPFSTIVFKIDGVAIGLTGQYNQLPYEYEVDFSQYTGQEIVLTVELLNRNGNTLSASDLPLVIQGLPVEEEEQIVDEEGALVVLPEETADPAIEETPCPEGAVCLGDLELKISQLVLIGVVLAALVILVIVVVKIGNKKKATGEAEKVSLFDTEATLDGFAMPAQFLGTVTILGSDDAMMKGKEYRLMKPVTTLGRSVSNDIALPKDSAVSRNHARLVFENGKMYLRQVMKTASDGSKTPPTYGTFLNGKPIKEEAQLKSGDEFKLGSRASFRFEAGEALKPAPAGDEGSEGVTIDGIRIGDDLIEDDDTRNG